MSAAYEAFLSAYIGANSWAQRKDGCPLDLLDRLDDVERGMAEDELIARLGSGDHWPISGLGHLRSKKAEPYLRKLLQRSKETVLAHTALALWMIARDDSMSEVLVELSKKFYTDGAEPLNTHIMIDIIHCLAQVPHASARSRLKELEGSGDYLISYNAKYAQDWYRPDT